MRAKSSSGFITVATFTISSLVWIGVYLIAPNQQSDSLSLAMLIASVPLSALVATQCLRWTVAASSLAIPAAVSLTLELLIHARVREDGLWGVSIFYMCVAVFSMYASSYIASGLQSLRRQK